MTLRSQCSPIQKDGDSGPRSWPSSENELRRRLYAQVKNGTTTAMETESNTTNIEALPKHPPLRSAATVFVYIRLCGRTSRNGAKKMIPETCSLVNASMRYFLSFPATFVIVLFFFFTSHAHPGLLHSAALWLISVEASESMVHGEPMDGHRCHHRENLKREGRMDT